MACGVTMSWIPSGRYGILFGLWLNLMVCFVTELIRDTATWHVTIPDQIRPDRPDRPYRPDLTRPAGYDQTWPDMTRPDQIRPDQPAWPDLSTRRQAARPQAKLYLITHQIAFSSSFTQCLDHSTRPIVRSFNHTFLPETYSLNYDGSVTLKAKNGSRFSVY